MRLTPRHALLALAAVLLVPAFAPAADAKTPTVSQVKRHVRLAHHALGDLRRAAAAGDVAAAGDALSENRLEVRRAARRAKKMARTADSTREAVRASRATRVVAREQNVDMTAFADLLDEVSGELQQALADALESTVGSRDQILDMLQGLIDQVPVDDRLGLTASLESLATAVTDIVNHLLGDLQGGLPTDVGSTVEGVLGTIQSTLSDLMTSLGQEIVPLLPAEVQGVVQSALQTVSGVLDQVFGMVREILGGLTGSGGSDSGGSTGGLLDGLLGGFHIPILSDLLGGLFGRR